MSHFTVLVIGNEPEELLEPFSEHIEVPKTSEVSEDEKQSFIEAYTIVKPDRSYGIKDEAEAEKNKLLSFDELYDQYGEDWNDSAWKKDANGIWCEFSTYNPNSKWDWYQLGGRWAGFFKVKKGADSIVGERSLMGRILKAGYADQLLKKDVDFEGMRADAVLLAAERFDSFHYILDGRELIPMSKFLEKYPENVDQAREEYFEQETVKDLNKAGYHFNIAEFIVPREEFLRKAELSAFSTFAFLNEKGWCERGNMGWWGIVTNEKDDEQWIIEFNKMLDELPDDTLLSLYDCHI